MTDFVQNDPEQHVFNFLTPVWGKGYSARFLQFVVPSMLSPGNLPEMEGCDVSFTILTRAEDIEAMHASPAMERVRRFAKVNYEVIDDILDEQPQALRLHLIYQRGLAKEARDHQQVNFVILNSDVLFADGDLRYLRGCAEAGRRCVLEAVFRANQETLLPELAKKVGEGGQLNLSSRELVDLGLRHLHPATATAIWNRTVQANRLANRLYWKVGDEGLLSRNYLLHPLMFRPKRRIEQFEGFIDYAYVPLAFPDSDDHFIITDSDDFFRLEFSPPDYEVYDLAPGPFSPSFAASCLEGWTTEDHRGFAATTIRYHSRDCSDVWDAVERQADETIRSIATKFRRAPMPALAHPYWENNRSSVSTAKTPRVLEACRKKLVSAMMRMRRHPRFDGPWLPHWLRERHNQAVVEICARMSGRVLLVGSFDDPLTVMILGRVSKDAEALVVEAPPVSWGAPLQFEPERPWPATSFADTVILVGCLEQQSDPADLVIKSVGALRANGRLLVIARACAFLDGPEPLRIYSIRALLELVPLGMQVQRVSEIGNSMAELADRSNSYLLRKVSRHLSVWPLAIIVLPIVIAQSLVTNLIVVFLEKIGFRLRGCSRFVEAVRD